ncbi:MAG: PCRF domain-containing protein, partial [Chloroflexota bacterium]
MLEQISKIVDRYDELERQMAEPDILADYHKLAELAQERSELEPLVQGYHEHQAVSKEMDEAQELLDAAEDDEMRIMAQEELELLATR